MGRVYSVNFSIVPPENAKIPVMDRGFLYGDSIYEVVRTYKKTGLFLLDRHYERLLRSAGRIFLKVPFSLEKLEGHIRECVRNGDFENSYVRIIVSRGQDSRFSLMGGDHLEPNVVIVTDQVPTYPESYFSQGINVALVSVRRNLRDAVDPNIKTGNYLNNMLAMMEAQRSGALDAVMLNYQDMVTEGTTSNVFMVKKETVLTPPVESGLLEGISRAFLKELIRREGISFEEREISRQEFLDADEVFLTGTTKEVMPVTKLDGKPVQEGKPGPLTRKLMKLFHDEVDRVVRV